MTLTGSHHVHGATKDGYDRLDVPSFACRGSSIVVEPEEAVGWLDVCSTQRLTWVFLHTADDDWWLARQSRLWLASEKRGRSLELGGHVLHRRPGEL
jgi:hypothetical protein